MAYGLLNIPLNASNVYVFTAREGEREKKTVEKKEERRSPPHEEVNTGNKI